MIGGVTHYEVRVLAIVEGYVVARVKGCAPFIASEREFLKNHQPAPRAS